jgi:subtilisin family serine protease
MAGSVGRGACVYPHVAGRDARVPWLVRRLPLMLLLILATACNGPASPPAAPSHLSDLDLGGSPTGTIDVEANGSWSATTDASWLEIAPATGSGPARVDVTARRAGLTPGTRAANVEIRSGDERSVVRVTSRFPTIAVQAAHAAGTTTLSVPPSVGERPVEGHIDAHPFELVVTLHHPGADGGRSSAARALALIARDHGAEVVGSIFTASRTVATLRLADGAERTAQRLRDDPRVHDVAPSVRVQRLAGDPLSPQQAWHYDAIALPDAWTTTMGSSLVTVAVIDDGFDMRHEDLEANLEPGYDFGDGDADPHADTLACGDHGTHVAGTVAAPSNGLGGTGVAPAVTIVPLKVGSYAASTTTCDIWSTALVAAIYHAAGAHVSGATARVGPVDVINLSLGLTLDLGPVREAVQFAAQAGVTLVAATGNTGERGVLYPAAYPEVIAVGATNAKSQRAGYSNYGPEAELMAPGGEGRFSVTSTRWSETHDAYGGMQGTSMATPHVTGVVALMKSANPALAPTVIRHLLQATAHDIGDTGWDERTGFGIVDAAAAVRAAHGSAFRLHLLDAHGAWQLIADATNAASLRHHQADFGTYRAEVGIDADGDGIIGEPGEWYGSATFDITPDGGDLDVVIELTLQ